MFLPPSSVPLTQPGPDAIASQRGTFHIHLPEDAAATRIQNDDLVNQETFVPDLQPIPPRPSAEDGGFVPSTRGWQNPEPPVASLDGSLEGNQQTAADGGIFVVFLKILIVPVR